MSESPPAPITTILFTDLVSSTELLQRVEAIERETEGNPFFVREVLLHLLEEGKLEHADGRFTSRFSIEEMGIPEGIRQVLGRRLSRLSGEANRLLAAASACAGGFRFDVAGAVAELDESVALDALDGALEAQIVRPTSEPEIYEFTHALIRHTLYGGMSPSRRVRLHRRLAEHIGRLASASGHALEIARHYLHSKALPGAEGGVAHAIVAAGRAEATGAHEEAVTAWQLALELLPAGDPRRPRALARLGLALAWDHREEAARVAGEAAELIAASEGHDAAADYLVDAASAVSDAGSPAPAWTLAEQGLRYAGSRRDVTWAVLRGYDLDRLDAEDPDFPGIGLDTPERAEISRILHGTDRIRMFTWAVFESRRHAMASLSRRGADPQAFWAGEYRRALPIFETLIEEELERGQLAAAGRDSARRARLLAALGELTASAEALSRAVELHGRSGRPPLVALDISAATSELVYQRGEAETLAPVARELLTGSAPSQRLAQAIIRSAVALIFAFAGRREDALRTLASVVPAVERGAGWAFGYTTVVCWAIETLWRLDATEFLDLLERNLRDKTLAPDFRHPSVDARRALAQLCALGGRFDEAREWFDRARTVLEEQGARPLRALVDFDEAWMEIRRVGRPDRPRALALLDGARAEFEAIGMTGWLRHADRLRDQLVAEHPPAHASRGE